MISRSLSCIPTITRCFTNVALFPKKVVLDVLKCSLVLSSSPFTDFTFATRTRPVSTSFKMNESSPVICSRDLVTDPISSGTAESVTSQNVISSTTDIADCTAVSVMAVDDVKMDAEDESSGGRKQLKRKHYSTRTKKGKKLDKHPKKIAKFANDEKFDETSYYFENGLRKVKPYVYIFETHVKGRWMKRPIMDVFKTEFRMESPEYYRMAINRGLITINGQRVTPDKILVNNEFLRSMVHRHEPPVTGEPLDIIAVNDEFVVLNKPASIPVHPCGKYRHNTIIFMLGKEHSLTGLHTIHRLDRLTSGLLMFARTREVSQRLDAYVRDRKLTKVYVCKVQGEFPSEPLECAEPIYTLSHKIGVCRVSPDGKQSRTAFKRLSYDGHTSIVQCTPHTGRMHQIRVHLQYLGYPIVNDPLYNNPVWGPKIGKGGEMPHTSDSDLLTALIEQHTAELKSQTVEDPHDFVGVTRSHLVPVTDDPNGVDSTNEGARSNENCLVDVQVKRTNVASCQNEAGLNPSKDRTEVVSGAAESESCIRSENTNKQSEIGRHSQLKEGSHDQLVTLEQTLEGSVLQDMGQKEERPPELADDKELQELVQCVCRECKLKLRDPTPDEMMMYLHALSYKGPGFEFSTPLPKWAEEHIQKSAALKEISS